MCFELVGWVRLGDGAVYDAPSWACSAIRRRSKVNLTDEECVDVVIRRTNIDGLHSTQLTDSYYDTILLIIKGGHIRS